MSQFVGIQNKVNYWLQNQNELHLKGITPQQWILMLGNFFKQSLLDEDHLMICSDIDEAEEVYEAVRNTVPTLFYPGHNHGLFSSVLSSEKALLDRWGVLNQLCSKSSHLIITTMDAALLMGPGKDFFQEHKLIIRKDDIYSPLELASKLTELGYFPASTVEEPGTFARKGEIFDIYPVTNSPIRLHYFDDLVEDIFSIDVVTQKTLREKSLEFIEIIPAPGFLTRDQFSTTLRKNIPQPNPALKISMR